MFWLNSRFRYILIKCSRLWVNLIFNTWFLNTNIYIIEMNVWIYISFDENKYELFPKLMQNNKCSRIRTFVEYSVKACVRKTFALPTVNYFRDRKTRKQVYAYTAKLHFLQCLIFRGHIFHIISNEKTSMSLKPALFTNFPTDLNRFPLTP